jgi:L-ascorbate metabolism protein UlaG (beta-lactamase superfamily)
VKLLTRRRALLGLGAVGATGALEYRSLHGAFDHRAVPKSAATGKGRYEASIARLEADAALAAGAIVHVGHSTHLLSVAGARFLTDPWFYDPAFGALAHTAGPAAPPEDIGRLDAALVTHDHADHADPRAMDRLDKQRAIVATEALAAKMRALGFREVHVLAPWESMRVGAVTVTAVPGLHDIYEIGFVLEGAGRTVYFAGDTQLFRMHAAIAERFPRSFAILPVDGTRLRGDPLHVMTPDDAVRAARILGARGVMPSHAEAGFSDPLVDGIIATTIQGAGPIFRVKMAEQMPGTPCALPAAGDLVAVAADEKVAPPTMPAGGPTDR